MPMCPQRLKKWTRSRTGCYTCRKRRIKCDERKPLCLRCTIGSRECLYPSTVEVGAGLGLRHAVTEANKPLGKEPSSETSDKDDDSVQTTELSYAWTSNTNSPSFTLDNTADYTTLMLPDFEGVGTCQEWKSTADPFPNFFYGYEPSFISAHLASIQKRPSVILDDMIQFFLSFHRENINRGRYLWYYDYNQFIRKGLLDLAKQCDSLQYAIAAFSSLVYSLTVDRRGKQFAFLFYAKAVRQLQRMINTVSLDDEDSVHKTVATILELASVERVVADTIKCFRHAKGAALIIQRCSTPTQLCSTVLGRSLLQWYNYIEDHCCMLLAAHSVLPKVWRREDFKMRRRTAVSEYAQFSKDKLKAKILDDLWQEIWLIVPHMADVLATIPQLSTLTGASRAKTIAYLESELIYILDYLATVRASPYATELLQTVETGFPLKTRHSECCPALPFPPYRFLYPTAGMLLLCFLSLPNYVRIILYGPIRAAGSQIEKLETECRLAESYAYEICRGYAAIEDEFGYDATDLLPCFNLLAMAGFSVPKELRKWLWHKLAHFEQLGPSFIEPVKKNLSVVWGMPELLTQSFDVWKEKPIENRIEHLNADDIDTAAKIVVTEEECELMASGDESDME